MEILREIFTYILFASFVLGVPAFLIAIFTRLFKK